MHFMNPVPVMKLVEVISGLATSKDTLDTTLKLAQQMGKTCTHVTDMPGFIANRLLMPYVYLADISLYISIVKLSGCNLSVFCASEAIAPLFPCSSALILYFSIIISSFL